MSKFRLAILVAIIAYFATGIAQIRPDERGVVRRFGKVVARPGPGLWVGFPWGIDRIDRVSIRNVRQMTVGGVDDNASTQYLTGDQNLVAVRLVVGYAANPLDGEIEQYVINRDQAEIVLARETEAAATEWLAARPVDEILLMGRTALATHLQNEIATRLAPHRLGIVIQRVSVESLNPPDDVRDAFERVNQAQTEMLTKENQARQDADRRLRESEALQFRLAAQSESYRIEKESLAKADAASFLQRLSAYRTIVATNPDALNVIWWDETGRILLGLKGRSRIDLLDSYIGKDGLDLSQFMPQKK
jgi:modulator of FtsH protease HflK